MTGIALWLPVWLTITSVGGCAQGTTGVLRPLAPTVYTSITNDVTKAQPVIQQFVPAPYNTAIEAGGAAVLALLAAWQGVTHNKLQTLTDQTTTTTTTPKV